MSPQAGDRLSRLLALVPWLVAHDGVTITECAAHFGVSEEQLERDLWLVVMCGIPGYGPDQLVDIDFWDDGVIHVIDPQTLTRPLRLTHDEAVTLLVALRMLAQLPGIDDRDAIVSAAAKIEAHASTGGEFVAVTVDVDPLVTQSVDAALAEGRALHLRYAAATRDEITERTVDPRRVLIVDGVGYLEAYCHSAEAVRTFRLDRIVTASPAGPITGPPEMPVEPPSEAVRAVLRITPAAHWIIDVHAGTQVLGEADGLTTVTVPMHSLDWGVRLVLSLHGQATAVGPEALVREVAEAARAARASYP